MERQIHLTQEERNYNEICSMAMVHLYMASLKSNIYLSKINIKDKEQLFLVSVAVALGGAIGIPVQAQGSRFAIARLNKKLGLVGDSKIGRITDKKELPIQIRTLLEDIRPAAERQCGPDFNFGKIYEAFYERKK